MPGVINNLYIKPINIHDAISMGLNLHEASLAAILTRNLIIPEFYDDRLPSEIIDLLKSKPYFIKTQLNHTTREHFIIINKDFDTGDSLPKNINKIWLYIKETASLLERQSDMFFPEPSICL